MSRGYDIKDYKITQTGVRFKTSDAQWQRVFDRCEQYAKDNIKQFGDRKVMQEGAKYQGVWLETQPMGGEMYATRDMEVALNNHLIFMQYQRRDGRMPGMITYREPWQGMAVHQDWMQGDFFTPSAMRMYYFIGEDKEYLKRLYECLRDFDEYLWNYRDSDGDGCIEAWCTWDTGDDNCTKLLINRVDATNDGAHCGETAPTDHGGMPFESAEYMAYSYSHRAVLAQISDILGNGEGDKWRAAAEIIQEKVRDYLWDDSVKAVFDRDRDNVPIKCLTLHNLKCMYHGVFTQEMADEFVSRHLTNPEEFFTAIPLPSIAANDPLFYVNPELNNFSKEIDEKIKPYMAGDSLDNSWSGPVGGLSVQRSLDALIGYGHHTEASEIGRRWINNLAKHDKYVQQYNPITGEPASGVDGYGPTVLSALEYITYLCGVDYVNGKLVWSSMADAADSLYEQTLFGHVYSLEKQGKWAIIRRDGEIVCKALSGVRITTDLDCNIECIWGMECGERECMILLGDNEYRGTIHANECLRPQNNGFVVVKRVPCDI